MAQNNNPKHSPSPHAKQDMVKGVKIAPLSVPASLRGSTCSWGGGGGGGRGEAGTGKQGFPHESNRSLGGGIISSSARSSFQPDSDLFGGIYFHGEDFSPPGGAAETGSEASLAMMRNKKVQPTSGTCNRAPNAGYEAATGASNVPQRRNFPDAGHQGLEQQHHMSLHREGEWQQRKRMNTAAVAVSEPKVQSPTLSGGRRRFMQNLQAAAPSQSATASGMGQLALVRPNMMQQQPLLVDTLSQDAAQLKSRHKQLLLDLDSAVEEIKEARIACALDMDSVMLTRVISSLTSSSQSSPSARGHGSQRLLEAALAVQSAIRDSSAIFEDVMSP